MPASIPSPRLGPGRLRLLLAATAALSLCAASAEATRYRTFAAGINNAGDVVGSFETYGGAPYAAYGFSYHQGVYTLLGSLFPQDINNSGDIAGYYGSHGFAVVGGVFQQVDVPGASYTRVYGINDIGGFSGEFQDASGAHGFTEQGGVFTRIDHPGGVSGTFASGNNDAGDVTGHYVGPGPQYDFSGYVLSGGVFSALEIPGATVFGEDVNNTGAVGGWYSVPAFGRRYGFIEQGGVYTTIDAPGASPDTEVLGINDLGAATGWFEVGIDYHGFVYSDGKFTVLDVPDDILPTVPEPATWLSMILGFTLLGLGARRSRAAHA